MLHLSDYCKDNKTTYLGIKQQMSYNFEIYIYFNIYVYMKYVYILKHMRSK